MRKLENSSVDLLCYPDSTINEFNVLIEKIRAEMLLRCTVPEHLLGRDVAVLSMTKLSHLYDSLLTPIFVKINEGLNHVDDLP